MTPGTRCNPSSIQRAGLLMLGGIGDLLVCRSTLVGLRELCPEARIHLVLRPWLVPLARLFPEVDGLIPYRKGARLAAALWNLKPDVWMDLHTPTHNTCCSNRRVFTRNALIGAAVRAPVKIGFALPAYRRLLTHPVAYTQEDLRLPVRRLTFRLLSPLGGEAPPDTPPLLSLPDEACRELLCNLPAAAAGEGEPPVLVHFFGKQPAKNWPLAHAETLLSELRARRIPALLLGGPDEQALCERLARDHGAQSLAGRLDLAQTAALMRVRCRFFIGIDSGPMHLAAACGCAGVALMSAHNLPGLWEPEGPGLAVERRQVPCSPCFLPVCPRNNLCMRRIEPETVLGRLLRPGRGAA